MRTSVFGRTYESQIGHLPSHFSHSRPTEMPGCFRHMIRSGWCFAIGSAAATSAGGEPSRDARAVLGIAVRKKNIDTRWARVWPPASPCPSYSQTRKEKTARGHFRVAGELQLQVQQRVLPVPHPSTTRPGFARIAAIGISLCSLRRCSASSPPPRATCSSRSLSSRAAPSPPSADLDRWLQVLPAPHAHTARTHPAGAGTGRSCLSPRLRDCGGRLMQRATAAASSNSSVHPADPPPCHGQLWPWTPRP